MTETNDTDCSRAVCSNKFNSMSGEARQERKTLIEQQGHGSALTLIEHVCVPTPMRRADWPSSEVTAMSIRANSTRDTGNTQVKGS